MALFKNFIYNSAMTVSSYLVNFVIFTVISRTLGANNIGIVGYVDNIINYFVIFASLGINTVGIREIASAGNDREKCSKVFSKLLSLMILTVAISTIVYIVVILTIPQLSQYRSYFLIGLGKLLLTPLMIEWLYAGKQDFKFISIRTIVIKLLYLIAVLCFVRDTDDTIIYFSLTSISVVINFIVNIVSSKKYINYKSYSWDFRPYLKPLIKLGAFAVITSLYSTFNYVFLGSVSTALQVGFYYTAIRLYDVIMQVFRSYTSVAMPKMSELNADSDKASFNNLIEKSYKALFSYSIPMAVVSILLAPLFVMIIAGHGYEPSVDAMRIVMPILIISGINQINGMLVLMPLKKDEILLITASIAAFVGVISNIVFDKPFGANGAALTILLSELTGCVGGVLYTMRNNLALFPYKIFVQYLLTSVPYFAIFFFVRYFFKSFYPLYIVSAALMIVYFFIQQVYICKNEILLSILHRIMHTRQSISDNN